MPFLSTASRAVVVLALGLYCHSADGQVVPGRIPAIPTPVDFSDNDSEGMDSIRIENEFKLGVPDDLVDSVWAYFERRYRGSLEFLALGGERFEARFSNEYFLDRYFDTPDLWLVAHRHGVRHRSRAIPGDVANRKHGRQLMQIKLSGVGDDSTSRGEIKYEIRRYDATRRNLWPEDRHPVLGIIKRSQRPAFRTRLAALGIDPEPMALVLDIYQHRRRVYVVDGEGVFASLTLDQATGRRWWMRKSFTEMELELNEIRYTAADSAGRHYMRTVNERMLADLLAHFPQLSQDQTPKYNKMFDAMSRENRLFQPMVYASFRSEQIAAHTALALMLMFLAGRWLFFRMRESWAARQPVASRLDTARSWPERY
jgi:hypothetical protein